MPLSNHKLSINTIIVQKTEFLSVRLHFFTDFPYHLRGDVISFLIHFQPDNGPQCLVSQPPSLPL